MPAKAVHVRNQSDYVIKFGALQITNPIPVRAQAVRTLNTLRTLYPTQELKLLRNGRRLRV